MALPVAMAAAAEVYDLPCIGSRLPESFLPTDSSSALLGPLQSVVTDVGNCFQCSPFRTGITPIIAEDDDDNDM